MIQYISLARNYYDDIINIPTSNFNEIYNNNFKNNGKDGEVNAIDSLPTSENHYHDNYWGDSKHIDEDQDGDEDNSYGLSVQFLGIIMPFSFKYDFNPFCRKFGWLPKNERIPYIPVLEEPENTAVHVGESLTFTASTTDINEDFLYYKWDWGDGNITIENNNGNYYKSGEKLICKHIWTENGSYNICVSAVDVYKAKIRDDGEQIVKECFDGESEWSIPVEIRVYKREDN
jgi:hypothetical protein